MQDLMIAIDPLIGGPVVTSLSNSTVERRHSNPRTQISWTMKNKFSLSLVTLSHQNYLWHLWSKLELVTIFSTAAEPPEGGEKGNIWATAAAETKIFMDIFFIKEIPDKEQYASNKSHRFIMIIPTRTMTGWCVSLNKYESLHAGSRGVIIDTFIVIILNKGVNQIISNWTADVYFMQHLVQFELISRIFSSLRTKCQML